MREGETARGKHQLFYVDISKKFGLIVLVSLSDPNKGGNGEGWGVLVKEILPKLCSIFRFLQNSKEIGLFS